jgi:hypothetical protein
MFDWRAIPWRYVAYAVAAGLFAESVVLAARAGWFQYVGSEHGPVEYAQQLLCAASVILFARAAACKPDLSDVFALAAYCTTLGLVRELDAFLDHVAYKGAYKLPAALLGGLALLRVWRSKDRFASQLERVAARPACVIAAVGALVVLVYAQIVGQKSVWMAVMGADYIRPVKDAAEELEELLGYLLIFIAALDAYVSARKW